MTKTRPNLSDAILDVPDAPPEVPRAVPKVKDPTPKVASRPPALVQETGERGHGADKKPFTVWLPIELITELRELSKYLKKTTHKNEGSVEALAQAAFRAEIDRWNKVLGES